jgi:hypothetical protein
MLLKPCARFVCLPAGWQSAAAPSDDASTTELKAFILLVRESQEVNRSSTTPLRRQLVGTIGLKSFCGAGLHMPSRASSGALHRLSAIRHMVRTQRPARAMSAKNLQKLFEYGVYACPFPCVSALHCRAAKHCLLPCSSHALSAFIRLLYISRVWAQRTEGGEDGTMSVHTSNLRRRLHCYRAVHTGHHQVACRPQRHHQQQQRLQR